jgi:hypothetical protein
MLSVYYKWCYIHGTFYVIKVTSLLKNHVTNIFYVHVAVNRDKFLFNKTNGRTIFPNLFLSRNSTCFGQFLCPSSGFFHCTFGSDICHAVLMTYTSAECTVDDGQRNCPKHVKFLDKNKFGKSARLLFLLKRNVAKNFALKYERACTSLIYFEDCLSLTTNYFSNTFLFIQFIATGYMIRLTNEAYRSDTKITGHPHFKMSSLMSSHVCCKCHA